MFPHVYLSRFQAHSLGLLDSSRRGRARVFPRGSSRGLGRGHGRGRGYVSRSAAVLDKRPKQLLVEGYSGEERDLITRRFKVLLLFYNSSTLF